MRTRMSAAVIVVSLVFAAAAAIAQNPDNGNAGQITGTVRDSGGNTMPGVRVEVTSPALAEKVRSMWTDTNGQYRFTALPVGTYQVRFSLNGFNPYVQSKVVITRGFTARVNATMTVGPDPGVIVPLPPAPPADKAAPRPAGGVVGRGTGTGGGFGNGVAGGIPGGVAAGVPGGVAGGVVGSLPSVSQMSRESYDSVQENGLRRVATDPLSTFSIDVDTRARSASTSIPRPTPTSAGFSRTAKCRRPEQFAPRS